jgi:hypothetical protein
MVVVPAKQTGVRRVLPVARRLVLRWGKCFVLGSQVYGSSVSLIVIQGSESRSGLGRNSPRNSKLYSALWSARSNRV